MLQNFELDYRFFPCHCKLLFFKIIATAHMEPQTAINFAQKCKIFPILTNLVIQLV